MNARTEPIGETGTRTKRLDVDEVFRANYSQMPRIIGRIVRDPARAEELAVEVFCRLWSNPRVPAGALNAWLYTTSVRIGLDELRRRSRRQKREQLFSIARPNPSPEQQHSANQRQEHVQSVLGVIKKRDAELLILRGEGLTYQELAHTLSLNPASIGTLLKRVQLAFKKEYRRRYE